MMKHLLIPLLLCTACNPSRLQQLEPPIVVVAIAPARETGNEFTRREACVILRDATDYYYQTCWAAESTPIAMNYCVGDTLK